MNKKKSPTASEMGKMSADARKKKWGNKQFAAKMKEWGKLGGRPKNTRP